MQMLLTALFICLGIAVILNLLWLSARVLEQQQQPRLSVEVFSAFLRETAATMLMFLGAPLALLPHSPRPARGDLTGHPPVLLIPGYGLTRIMMWPLAMYLRQRGRWVWAINNPIFEDDIPTFAAHAQRAVLQLKEATGAEQVDIVGHSMGGIIGAWYIAHLGGAPHVRRLVTLGTPWMGTRMAIFGLGRQSRSLQVGASTVHSLQHFTHDTVAVWSGTDCVVLPSQSAAPAHAKAIDMTGIGHLELVLHPTAWQAIRDALGATAP